MRFARWFGEERPAADLRPPDVEAYVETFGANSTNAGARAEALKSFLAFAHKQKLMPERLVSHVRVRKATASKARPASSSGRRGQDDIHLTAEGRDGLVKELEDLKAQRPRIAADLAAARVDKDVRENAPLEAAREAQGRVESRIREVEAILRHTVVIGGSPTTDVAHIGSTVTLSNLASGTKVSYKLVSPHEARPTEGKLSIESPVGRSVMGHRAGDEVEVAAPSGVMRFRVESVTS